MARINIRATRITNNLLIFTTQKVNNKKHPTP